MTKQSSFKRYVRARMQKTGESYTTARAAMLAGKEANQPATAGPVMQVADQTIRDRTGRGWEEWLDLLDEWGAGERDHAEIAAWLEREHGIAQWYGQAVTVGYERARGGREVGEHADGFAITASKTVGVPVERLYDAVVDEVERTAWLEGRELVERTATKPKSARFDWPEGSSRVNAFFDPKGEAKSRVVIEHERLPSAEDASRLKAWWRQRVTELKSQLESGPAASEEGARNE